MVLHHVPDRSGLLVEASAALHAEALSHGDLHAGDVAAVPDRLQEGVGKAEEEQVLHRLLPQVTIDTEKARIWTDNVQRAVKHMQRSQVVTKCLLDNHAGI